MGYGTTEVGFIASRLRSDILEKSLQYAGYVEYGIEVQYYYKDL